MMGLLNGGISDDLIQRLREIAARENRSINDVLRSMIDRYLQENKIVLTNEVMSDDDIANLPVSVPETVEAYLRKKVDRKDTE